MRLEEAQQGGEQRWIVEAAPELVGPDSGQIDKPLRPTLSTERCGKRSEGKRYRVPQGAIWYPGCHSLECVRAG